MSEWSELFQRILDLQQAGADDLEERIWDEFGCERAVLVLDSTGFTRITSSHGIVHYLEILTRLRQTVMPLFDSHGSLRSRAEADNIYAEFESIDAALDAAMAANREIASQKLMLTETEPFSLCIGIGFGQVLECGHDGMYGAEMNLASKLGEDLAEAREILLTEAAWSGLSAERRDGFDKRVTATSGTSINYYWMRLPRH